VIHGKGTGQTVEQSSGHLLVSEIAKVEHLQDKEALETTEAAGEVPVAANVRKSDQYHRAERVWLYGNRTTSLLPAEYCAKPLSCMRGPSSSRTSSPASPK
jgi:hypothetical protein